MSKADFSNEKDFEDLYKQINQIVRAEVKSKMTLFVYRCILREAIDKDCFYYFSKDKKLIAFAICKNKTRKGYFYIDNIATRSDERGKGFGRLLLKDILKKYNRVALDVVKENTGAIRFYEKYGFKKIAERFLGKNKDLHLQTMLWENKDNILQI